MDSAVGVLSDMQTMKDGLKDTCASLAEELDVKPALLMKAARVAYKASLGEEKDKMSAIEDLLTAAGRA